MIFLHVKYLDSHKKFLKLQFCDMHFFMKKSYHLFLSLFLILSCAHAQLEMSRHSDTIVISDIDDTIKATQVLSGFINRVDNSFESDNAFYGMSRLYREIQKSTSANFYYVSGSPIFMMSLYNSFLETSGFPLGELRQRLNLLEATYDFKIRMIEDIIARSTPQRLILLGDNGERDSDVYAYIKNKYPQLEVFTFIRYTYPVSLKYKNQNSFVSAFDVAWVLGNYEIISNQTVNEIRTQILNQLLLEQSSESDSESVVLPTWQDCKGFQAAWFQERYLQTWLMPMWNAIKNRCLLQD